MPVNKGTRKKGMEVAALPTRALKQIILSCDLNKVSVLSCTDSALRREFSSGSSADSLWWDLLSRDWDGWDGKAGRRRQFRGCRA